MSRGWVCSNCSFENESWRVLCAMCSTLVGASAPAPAASRDAGCPHVRDISKKALSARLFQATCSVCDVKGRNLMCLDCHMVLCGRLDSHHMADHQLFSHHGMAMALDTQEAWCYKCDKRVEHPALERLVSELSRLPTVPPPRPSPSSSSPAKPASYYVPFVPPRRRALRDDELGPIKLGTPGVKGLVNLGNTCFFNSVLQCLFKTAPLVKYFDGTPPHLEGELTGYIRKLFRDEWRDGDLQLRPAEAVDEICKRAKQFLGFGQHDAQDLLHSLLNMLEIEEIKRYKQLNGMRSRVPVTFVRNTFLGRATRIVRCGGCGTEFPSVDTHFDLSLPIPGRPEDEPERCPPKHQLTACLAELTKIEAVDGAECRSCNAAGFTPSATLRLELRDPPEILVLHIKRLTQTDDGVLKDCRKVLFPAALDVLPFMERDARRRGLPSQYTLYGVVEHSGRMSTGHFVAFTVDTDRCWRRYSDTIVTVVSEATVLSAEPYLLFYARAPLEAARASPDR